MKRKERETGRNYVFEQVTADKKNGISSPLSSGSTI
jgi:hypothetical protein